MRHFRTLLPLSLASLGAAEIVGQWTAWTLSRTCSNDGGSCTYHLALDQNPNAKTDLSSCIWTVVSANPAIKPANQSDFANVQCGAKLSLNGGWSAEGFYTIVPTDTMAKAYAFFGFTDEEIQNGKAATPRQRPAYRVGSFSEGEHPDLGLGKMDKHMKMEKRGSLFPGPDHTEREPFRGPFYCKHHPTAAGCPRAFNAKREKKMNQGDHSVQTPKHIIAMTSNQQQDSSSSSSSQKMGKMMQMEKRQSGIKKQAMLLHTEKQQQQQQQQQPSSNTMADTPSDSADEQQTWQIRSLSRLTNYPLNLTLFTFSIFSTTSEATPPPALLANCTIEIPSSSPTKSWYGQRCRDPLDVTNTKVDFTVGWGYKADTDSAVMTVCRPGTGMAWFGWDGVSSNMMSDQQRNGRDKVEVVFGDSKRERVHEVSCT
ncbi:hypothetical protein B0T21DRAFT_349052 [Apiosordaria backusii]|uniref:Uncharacterized protein n=1 Tax=Apiosordaria backusii TaxID=314023 RepID=A0AA40ED45_9PEZI|nr:hypothetical protein B0T21DRAFT_349052 [Apiosordaria backusii]